VRAAGVDGCRSGWICLSRAGGGPVEVRCVATAAGLFAVAPRPDVFAIDIPIGLTETGARRCDEEARALLGPRRTSVFPAPIRAVLEARDLAEGRAISRKVQGKSISSQLWSIVPKIREVDALLRADPSARRCVREVHPEVSFAAWNGKPMQHPKKSAAGRAERRALVDGYFGGDAFDAVRRQLRVRDVAHDDVLDAFAALWTAERILRGEARTVPAEPPVDAVGQRMEIVF